jgi:hypothetical protein
MEAPLKITPKIKSSLKETYNSGLVPQEYHIK